MFRINNSALAWTKNLVHLIKNQRLHNFCIDEKGKSKRKYFVLKLFKQRFNFIHQNLFGDSTNLFVNDLAAFKE